MERKARKQKKKNTKKTKKRSQGGALFGKNPRKDKSGMRKKVFQSYQRTFYLNRKLPG